MARILAKAMEEGAQHARPRSLSIVVIPLIQPPDSPFKAVFDPN